MEIVIKVYNLISILFIQINVPKFWGVGNYNMVLLFKIPKAL